MYKRTALMLLLISASMLAVQAQTTHWVATWASAQQQPRAGGPPRRPPAAAPASGAPASASATATPAPRFTPPPTSFDDQTVRMIMRVSLGGTRLRVHFSNAYGMAPLKIGAAHVALHDTNSAIVSGSDRPLMFNGSAGVTIPPGAEMISDAVDLNVPALGALAVSVYIPGDSGALTSHSLALHTAYIKSGDATAAPEMADARTAQAWFWVSGIDVAAPAASGTIVALGDSITDGATSTPDTDRSWPSVLAQRLAANPATANLAIVNEGISGNQVLADGAGVSALARFDRDVLAQAGVKWLMIMEGINDIGIRAKQGTVTSADLIGAMKQMIDRAHTHGIKVIGCTLTPYVGASYASDEGEVIREALNTFIRTPGNFDAVIDFDKVTRDPDNPKQILKAYNNTDHLHPNDAGYKAMADSIDLSIFTRN